MTPPANLRRDRNASSLAFFLSGPSVAFDRAMIDWLKQAAVDEGADSARICLHSGADDPFHQMVIVQRRGIYCRPHKHMAKAESCQIIDGELAFIVFADDGSIDGIARLGGNGIIGRAGSGQFHMVYPLSDWCTYHEAKPGPFLGDKDSVFPEWAPGQDDDEGRARFLDAIASRLAAHGNGQGR